MIDFGTVPSGKNAATAMAQMGFRRNPLQSQGTI